MYQRMQVVTPYGVFTVWVCMECGDMLPALTLIDVRIIHTLRSNQT
jgi:hypothetical protein